MTPKEKAKDIYDKIYQEIDHQDNYWGVEEQAKTISKILIDEVIATCPQKENEIFAVSKGIKYWVNVKKQI